LPCHYGRATIAVRDLVKGLESLFSQQLGLTRK
jgi:hypothetical protein